MWSSVCLRAAVGGSSRRSSQYCSISSTRQAVVGVDVEREQDLVLFDGQRIGEKAPEQHHHVRVGIGELNRVPPLASFGPVEKCASLMEQISLPSRVSSVLLTQSALMPALGDPSCRSPANRFRVLRPGVPSSIGLQLLRAQRDVFRPLVRRAGRHLQSTRNLFVRLPAGAKLSGLRSLEQRHGLESGTVRPRGVVASTRDFHSRSASSILVGATQSGAGPARVARSASHSPRVSASAVGS